MTMDATTDITTDAMTDAMTQAPAEVTAPAWAEVGRSRAHESAALHVLGQATYTDDIPELRGTLHAALVLSTQAHARIVGADLSLVLGAPGVVAVHGADFHRRRRQRRPCAARGAPGQNQL